MEKWFSSVASRVAIASGKPLAFAIALSSIALWALLGPKFKYSDTWQLVINTGTTIVTFLMVFLIQNTQNKDTAAIHVKLNEIIKALEAADNSVAAVEKLAPGELAVVKTVQVEKMQQGTNEESSH